MLGRISLVGIVLGCLVLAPTNRTLAQDVIVDKKLNFKLDLPYGFVSQPSMAGLELNVKHAAVRSIGAGDTSARFLFIEDTKTLLEQPVRESEQAPGIEGERSTEKWNGFEVDVVEKSDGDDSVVLETTVPLVPYAIKLRMIGLRSEIVELRANLKEALDGLNGETNWVGAAWDPAQILESAGTFMLCGMIVLAIFWVGKRSKQTAAEKTGNELGSETSAAIVEKLVRAETINKLQMRVAGYTLFALYVGFRELARVLETLEGGEVNPNWLGVGISTLVVISAVFLIVRDSLKIGRLKWMDE